MKHNADLAKWADEDLKIKIANEIGVVARRDISNDPVVQKTPSLNSMVAFAVLMAAGLCIGLWGVNGYAKGQDHAQGKFFQQSELSYADLNINEKNFPDVGFCTEFRVYPFDQRVSFEEAVKKMEQDGYKPANLQELLAYSRTQWEGKATIVALGQTWQDPEGNRCVLYLSEHYPGGWEGERALFLRRDWGVSGRFLAVRKEKAEAQ